MHEINVLEFWPALYYSRNYRTLSKSRTNALLKKEMNVCGDNVTSNDLAGRGNRETKLWEAILQEKNERQSQRFFFRSRLQKIIRQGLSGKNHFENFLCPQIINGCPLIPVMYISDSEKLGNNTIYFVVWLQCYMHWYNGITFRHKGKCRVNDNSMGISCIYTTEHW